MTTNLDKFRCTECGGIDVEEKRWVNLNTGESTDGDDSGDYWCNDCEDHVDVLTPGETE